MNNQKLVEACGVEVLFWYEGNTLFCRIPNIDEDTYCCGTAKMPETEDEVLAVTKSAWVW